MEKVFHVLYWKPTLFYWPPITQTFLACPAAAPGALPSGRGPLNLGGGSRILRAAADRTRTTREWIAANTHQDQGTDYTTANRVIINRLSWLKSRLEKI